MSFDAPPFNESARCPKCAYDAVLTEYKGALHRGCTLSSVYETYSLMGGIGVPQSTVDRYIEMMNEIPDHLERKCARCGHGWAERTVPSIEAIA